MRPPSVTAAARPPDIHTYTNEASASCFVAAVFYFMPGRFVGGLNARKKGERDIG